MDVLTRQHPKMVYTNTSVGLNEHIDCKKKRPKCAKKWAQQILKMSKISLEMLGLLFLYLCLIKVAYPMFSL